MKNAKDKKPRNFPDNLVRLEIVVPEVSSKRTQSNFEPIQNDLIIALSARAHSNALVEAARNGYGFVKIVTAPQMNKDTPVRGITMFMRDCVEMEKRIHFGIDLSKAAKEITGHVVPTRLIDLASDKFNPIKAFEIDLELTDSKDPDAMLKLYNESQSYFIAQGNRMDKGPLGKENQSKARENKRMRIEKWGDHLTY